MAQLFGIRSRPTIESSVPSVHRNCCETNNGCGGNLKKSTNYEKLKESLQCADEVEIFIYNKENNKIAWALIIPFNEDDCTVADYSATKFMDDWFEEFDTLTEQLQVA